MKPSLTTKTITILDRKSNSLVRSITFLLFLLSYTSLISQSVKDSATLLFNSRQYQKALPKLQLAFSENTHNQPLDTSVKIGLMLASTQEYLAKPTEAYQVLANTYSIVYDRDSTGILIVRVLNRMAFNLINSLFQYEMSLGILGEAERIRSTYHKFDHRYHAQTQEYLAMAQHGMGNYEIVMHKLEQAQNLYEKTIDSTSMKEMGMFYNNAANLMTAQSDYINAKAFYEKALHILVPLLGDRHPTIGTVYDNLGDIYRQQYNLSEAMRLGGLALSIAQENELPVNEMLATYNLSIYHILDNDYDKGIPLAEKALDLCRQNLGPDSYYMTHILDELSHVYTQLSQHDTAVAVAQQSLEIKLSVLGSIENAAIADSYFTIAQTLSAAKRYDEAEINARQSLDIRKSISNGVSKELANSYFQIGDILINSERFSEANKRYGQALEVLKQLPYSEDEQLDVLARHGDLKRIEGEYESAIDFYWHGLGIVSNQPLNQQVPSFESIRSSPNLFLIFRGLLQCHFLKYLKSQSEQDLTRAIALADLAVQYLSRENLLGSSQDAQFIFGNFNRSIYHFALRIYWQAWQDLGNSPKYFDRAWNIMNRSTHQSLQAAIRQNDAIEFAQLPDSLLREEQQIRQAIKLSESENINDASNAGLADLKIQYQELLGHFSEYYPEYYTLRYNPPHTSFREVMDQLSDSSQVIRYLLGDHTFYMMSLTQETNRFEFIEFDSTVQFGHWTDSLNLGLQQSNCSLFSNYSLKVSQSFLSPYVRDKTRELIIIPNDVLFRVNFEYLPIDTPTLPCRFNDLDYAINKYSFRYVYFPEELLKSRPVSPGKILAVAPGFSNRSQGQLARSETMGPPIQATYAALPWSMETAKVLQSELDADVLLGNKSSEKALKKTVENYAIIHFGTHAEVDDERPLMSKLVLSKGEGEEDGLLHTHEIYGLSLDAELVSLTACETGLGRIQAGEGMLSLARAFRYAGCPAVAMSLWKIDDQSSAGIMEHFYQELGKQKPKDVAMREAKLNYLKNNSGELKNPLYWAGMVLVGNVAPVQIVGSKPWLLYVGIIVLFALVIAHRLVHRVKMA